MIIDWRLLIFDGLAPIRIGGFRAAYEDCDELMALGNRRWDLATITKAFSRDDFEPHHRFTQLF